MASPTMRDGALDQLLLAGLAEIAVEQVADRGGRHRQLAHAVRVGADRGLGRLVERDAADDLLVGGVRPVGLPAGAEELRLERVGDEAVHLRGGDVGGGRVALAEAEMRQEGRVEGGLGRSSRDR